MIIYPNYLMKDFCYLTCTVPERHIVKWTIETHDATLRHRFEISRQCRVHEAGIGGHRQRSKIRHKNIAEFKILYIISRRVIK